MAEIEISDDEVTWRLEGLGPLVFDRAEYEAAVASRAGKAALPVPEEWDEWEEL